MNGKIWTCKIGELPEGILPDGADLPLRAAIEKAYIRETGMAPTFIFSGWDGELTSPERTVAENREPR